MNARINQITALLMCGFVALASSDAGPSTRRSRSTAAGPTTQPMIAQAQATYSLAPNPSGFPTAIVPVDPDDIAQQVSCVIQIDSDFDPTNGQRADNQTASALLTSSMLLDSAIDRVPEAKLKDRRSQTVVNAFPAGQQFVHLSLILTRGENKTEYESGAADKLLRALCDSLEAAFQESFAAASEAGKAKLDAIQKQLDLAKAQLAEQRKKSHDARDSFSDLSGSEYFGGDVENTLNNLNRQKHQIESELTRDRTRLAALDPGSGPLVTEWKKVVEMRSSQLDDLRKANKDGKASESDITEAENKLKEAKAQLDTAKSASSNRPGNPGEVASLQSQIAEAEQRLKPINDQMEKLRDPKVRELIDQIPDLQQEEQRLRNEINDLTNRADFARRNNRPTGSVTITVLDGK